jgi:sugar-specific transcriptional regulator TrmB
LLFSSNMSTIITLLEEIWFSNKEAQTYISLLKLWKSPASWIARVSGIKRITTYVILQNLVEKWIIRSINEDWILYFVATDPQVILDQESRRHEKIESLIPELKLISSSEKHRPKVIHYDGLFSVKKMYEDILCYNDWFYSIRGIQHTNKELLERLLKSFMKKRVKQWIFSKIIMSKTPQNLKYAWSDKVNLKETKLLQNFGFEVNTDTNIYWWNKVSICIFSEESLHGITIESESYYQSMKSVFDILREVNK